MNLALHAAASAVQWPNVPRMAHAAKWLKHGVILWFGANFTKHTNQSWYFTCFSIWHTNQSLYPQIFCSVWNISWVVFFRSPGLGRLGGSSWAASTRCDLEGIPATWKRWNHRLLLNPPLLSKMFWESQKPLTMVFWSFSLNPHFGNFDTFLCYHCTSWLPKRLRNTKNRERNSAGLRIHALDLSKEWRFALSALSWPKTRPNDTCYNSANSAASQAGHWEVSCQLLCSMSRFSVPNKMGEKLWCFSPNWDQMTQLVFQMFFLLLQGHFGGYIASSISPGVSLQTDVISYNCAVSSGSQERYLWSRAWEVLKRSQEVTRCRCFELFFFFHGSSSGQFRVFSFFFPGSFSGNESLAGFRWAVA